MDGKRLSWWIMADKKKIISSQKYCLYIGENGYKVLKSHLLLYFCFCDVYGESDILLLPAEWGPAEEWRLWPHPDRRRYQPDIWRHYSQYRCHRCSHQQRYSLHWHHLWWLGQRVNVWRSWAGDERHTPGAAHGRLRAALHRPPPPLADVKTFFDRRPRQPSISNSPEPLSKRALPDFPFTLPLIFLFCCRTLPHFSCIFSHTFPHSYIFSLSLLANHCLYLILVLVLSTPFCHLP